MLSFVTNGFATPGVQRRSALPLTTWHTAVIGAIAPARGGAVVLPLVNGAAPQADSTTAAQSAAVAMLKLLTWSNHL
jgi:hypothetical protein